MPAPYNQMPGLYSATGTFSGTKTGAISLGGCALAAIVTPASMVGTVLTFEAGTTESGTLPLMDDLGNAISVTCTSAAQFISLRRILPLGCAFLKVVSNAAANGDDGEVITVIGQGLAQ